VLRNCLEYLDRAGTFTAIIVVLLWLAGWRRPRLDPRERQWLLMALAWLVGGYGITVFVPVRSSLYACFPLVGAALVGAVLARSMWARIPHRRRRWLIAAAVMVPFLLVPLLRSRNVRWVRGARLSSATMDQIRTALESLPENGGLVLKDDPEARPRLAHAFGTLLDSAVALERGERPHVRYVPPQGDWHEARVFLGQNREPDRLACLELSGAELRLDYTERVGCAFSDPVANAP
jgi:hypothetical protein